MYHFIANPNARSGQGLALWEKIKLKLIAEHIDYQIHFTHHRHHATEIAAELTASGDPVTIMVTIVVTTVLVMGVSGRTAQFVLKKEEKKDE